MQGAHSPQAWPESLLSGKMPEVQGEPQAFCFGSWSIPVSDETRAQGVPCLPHSSQLMWVEDRKPALVFTWTTEVEHLQS